MAPPAAAITFSPSRAGRCTGISGLRVKRNVMTGAIQSFPRRARTSPHGTKIGGWPTRKSFITESSRPIGLDTRWMQPL